MVDRCRAAAKGGKPCSARPLPGRDVCPWHAPELAERRREWSGRGGKGKSNAARAKRALGDEAMTLAEVKSVLCRALRKVEAGQMEPGPANALASLARAITQVAEASEIEERVVALEAAAGIQRGSTA